jgi:endonuclease I
MNKLFFNSVFFFQLFIWSAISYSQIPPGYYDPAAGLSGTALQSALHNIIDNHTVRSYNQLWTDMQVTDDKPNGKVWDIYSDIPGGTPPYEYSFGSDQCGTYSQEGDCYNREHTFPKSWFGGEVSPMYSDLFQVMPADGYVNSQRSNYPYGEVGSYTWISQNGCKLGSCIYPGYNGTVFEPIDEYKGDVARNYFYMATRYYGEDGSWPGSDMVDGSQLKEWAKNMLLEWSNNDPVSQKEIDRNNAIYNLQDNRNPFIDHPEYIGLIWGDGLAEEPAYQASDFAAQNITLTWTDATGTYLPDSYLIRMSDSGFDAIAVPSDGVTVSDDFWNLNINYGVENCMFENLSPNTTYYFKIFGYSGSGNSIDYKTDGNIMQVSITTSN